MLRFASTHTDSSAQTVSLEDYVSRMKEGQEKIYYITADSYAAAKSSPHLELLRKKGIEVLLLSDRIDEWMMNYLTEFDGKPFQSVSKVDESLEKLADEVDESAKEAEKALTPFIDRVKALLGERVKDVRLTHRLTDTPAIVSTDADEMSTQMAKLFAAAGQKVPEVKYIFELNPDHVLVKRAADTEDEAKFSEWVELLLDQALLAERGTLEDPNLFIRRMSSCWFLDAMPDDLRVIRHFSFLHLHFPQIILPLTVSASGAFLEAIACWWYRLSLFQKIRHILRGIFAMRIILLGAPGAGKGTQAQFIMGEIWYSANLHWRYAACCGQIWLRAG
mgnify:CR=1 FL=1